MRVLVDTSAVISLTTGRDLTLKLFLGHLQDQGGQLCIATQTLYEYWSVATRPMEANGLQKSAEDAYQEMLALRTAFEVLVDSPDVFDKWLQHCRILGIKGRPSHDARIVAVMDVHGIYHLVTQDVTGFSRFPHLTVLTP